MISVLNVLVIIFIITLFRFVISGILFSIGQKPDRIFYLVESVITGMLLILVLNAIE